MGIEQIAQRVLKRLRGGSAADGAKADLLARLERTARRLEKDEQSPGSGFEWWSLLFYGEDKERLKTLCASAEVANDPAYIQAVEKLKQKLKTR